MLFTFKDTKPVPDGRRGAVRTPKHRLVRERGGWLLYDMQRDPEQKNNIANDAPAIVEKLANAFEAKWQEVTTAGFDPVPVPIGHPQRPSAVLPGHEALLHPAQGEGISYHGRAGWANDWIDNWTDAASFPAWPVDVVTAGRYEITLKYCCPAESVGSTIRAEIDDAAAHGTITEAHDPPPLPSPDRFPRPEVPEKEWKPLSLGTVALPEGRTEFVLRAERIAGGTMPQIKAVEIRPAGRNDD